MRVRTCPEDGGYVTGLKARGAPSDGWVSWCPRCHRCWGDENAPLGYAHLVDGFYTLVPAE